MGNKKVNVGILFGGKSAEHEVSLQSAKNVVDALDRGKYRPVLIGIDKSGKWYFHDQATFLLNADNPRLIKLNKSDDGIALVPQSEGKISSLSGGEMKETIDVVFPILHGTFGEDGTVQGLLKLADIPFVGAGVLGSAVGMDKDVMKRLLRDADVPIGRFIVCRVEERLPRYDEVRSKLEVPFFVKPANMGSSVGVHKVFDEGGFQEALFDAFQYDSKIVMEEFIKGREIECSVLGNHDPVASVPGEVISAHEFYSYEAKYIDDNGATLEIPAKLPRHTTERIKELAVTTFKVLSCEGLARVDFFLEKDDKVIVNEINTIPGFTSISMYPMLWKASGISYPELIDRLIQLAFERYEREKKLKTSYGA
jgi:D-alanine-D-alanine ligase